jgi:hypothetical protein
MGISSIASGGLTMLGQYAEAAETLEKAIN